MAGMEKDDVFVLHHLQLWLLSLVLVFKPEHLIHIHIVPNTDITLLQGNRYRQNKLTVKVLEAPPV